MGSRRRELIKLGELAAEQLRGPYADQLRGKIAEWRDPRAKVLRQRRRAVRRTRLWTATGVTTGGGAIVLETAVANPGAGGGVLIVAAAVSTFMAVTAGMRSWRLHKEPLPDPIRIPKPLPARGSAAREPMRRLDEAEDTLNELLTQLSRGALVPRDSVTQARTTGTEAATALRALAAQLHAVERARDHAPLGDRQALSAGVDRLRYQLDEGLDGYGRLVAAAGHALAASSQPGPRTELTDATDHLAALAHALRDLA
ncbi:phage shock envelope stress response protein PspM [Actinokineospora sp. HUAS TT18]|uniref:phage shock envelope stress response protein PspM n=1 Tax=Actinokineospora sp. HUAS TT18 TaxID=3447451 RepID=UPI003F51ACBC